MTAPGDASEALDPVGKTVDRVALLLERPVDRTADRAARGLLDLHLLTETAGNYVALVLRVPGCVGDPMADAFDVFDATPRLRASAPNASNRSAPETRMHCVPVSKFKGKIAPR